MSRITSFLASTLVFFMIVTLFGCQPGAGGQGIWAYFETSPPVYHKSVYWRGRVVGKIMNQEIGRGSVARFNLVLDPSFEARFGTNWAFFVDGGRLTAGQLSLNGTPLSPGQTVSGFNSRAAFNWFKFKTLLSDRLGKAMRRAGQLQLRFG
jgi:hypothetical protein